MSRLDRYTTGRLLPWIALGVLGAATLFLVTQLTRVAPLFVGSEAGAGELLGCFGLLMVPVAGWSLAPAFALAVFAVVGRMSADGELVALDASGVPRRRIARGPLLLAAGLTIVSALLWLWVVPGSVAELRGRVATLAARAAIGRVEAGTVAEPFPGVVVASERREGDRFEGVLIEHRDAGGRRLIGARRARIAVDGDGATLGIALQDGVGLFHGGGQPVALGFEQLEVAIPLGPSLEAALDFLPSELGRSTGRLWGPAPPGADPRRWRYALWRRFAAPVGFAALACCSLVLALGGRWRRRGSAVAVAAGLYLAFHLGGRALEGALAAEGPVGPEAAAFGPAAGIALLTLIVAWRWMAGGRAHVVRRG